MLCDAGEFLDSLLFEAFLENSPNLDLRLEGEFSEVGPGRNGVCLTCPLDTYQPENATDTPSCIECPPEAPRNLITGSTSAFDCVYGWLVWKVR